MCIREYHYIGCLINTGGLFPMGAVEMQCLYKSGGVAVVGYEGFIVGICLVFVVNP